jgi:hypothetical protein
MMPASSSIPFFLILIPVLLVLLALWVQGVRSPYSIVRIHARFNRWMMRAMYGANWETALRRLGRGRYANYLNKAASDPQEYHSRARQLQIILVLFSVVTCFILIVALFSLFFLLHSAPGR